MANKKDIIAIGSSLSVETEAEKSKNDLLDLVESQKTGRILSGIIQGVEQTSDNPPRSLAVVYHGEFKVIIPAEEAVEPPDDYRGRTPEEVHHYMLTKRLGAEVDYIVKGMDTESGLAVGSRLEAMRARRKEYFFATDRDGNNLIHSGVVAEARIVSVIRAGIFVDLFGLEIYIPLKELSYQRWLDAAAHFQPGQRVLVKVLEINRMYYMAGHQGGTGSFIITGMDTWDTSQVTNMFSMFEYSAIKATTYNIGNVGKWNVSKVKNMCRTFGSAGMRATNLYIGDLSNWNTSSVETMVYMFASFGWKSPSVNIGNIGNWNVSKVTNMNGMFDGAGYWAKTFYIGDLSGWDVSNVTDFGSMFAGAGNEATTFNIGNIGKWNVSKATEMTAMFYGAGTYSSSFYIGDLSNWNTANVTSMNNMFYNAGKNASWSLNCRNWNVKNVKYNLNFNTGVESKVTEPVWVN